MNALAIFFWGWLLGAFLLGFGMGWIAVVSRVQSVTKVWMRWLSLLAVALVAVSLTKIVPGRFGYWLDLLLVLFALYLVGCAIGSWLRNWVVSRARPAS